MSAYDSMLYASWDRHCAAQEEAAFEELVAWAIDDANALVEEAQRTIEAIPCKHCDGRGCGVGANGDQECVACGGDGCGNPWTVGEYVHTPSERLELLRIAGSALVKNANAAKEA